LKISRIRTQIAAQVAELDRRNISILSNNCVAGILYEWAELPKQTPTAGVYFVGPAYGQFLCDLAADHLDSWTGFTPSSLEYKETQQCWVLPGPTGGELVFLHYAEASVAVEKWTRRLARLAGRTPLVFSSIRDSIDPDSLATVLAQFRMTFTVSGSPAPPADELVLDRRVLARFSSYLDDVLAGAGDGRAVDEMLI
jgi:uncharacterized protein (DUF1919 family)